MDRLDELQGPPAQPDHAACVLVTGGAGYLGSHTAVELLQSGHDVVVVDDLSRSKPQTLVNVQIIAGRRIKAFHQCDLQDRSAVDRVFALHPGIVAVLHFAGLKSVTESWVRPLDYYRTNLTSTLNVLDAQIAAASHFDRRSAGSFLFASSACVYGEPSNNCEQAPAVGGARETDALTPCSPYARTKAAAEALVADVCLAHDGSCAGRPVLKAALMRYFNPVGAHSSGLLGEAGGLHPPANLVPRVTRVAAAAAATTVATSDSQASVKVYGTDWATPDGTAVRDYVHVVDVARAHARVLERLARLEVPRIASVAPTAGEAETDAFADPRDGGDGGAWNCVTYNIGSGRGASVLEVVEAVERASGVAVNAEAAARRPGDAGCVVSDPTRAWLELGWKSEKVKVDRVLMVTLDEICKDAWNHELRSLPAAAEANEAGLLSRVAFSAAAEAAE
ncbi:hypothetical protein HK405_008704 [Cladochytrium tenue]|nr:hypothetical protein HK405_008704 [Cladochytrium tenue]